MFQRMSAETRSRVLEMTNRDAGIPRQPAAGTYSREGLASSLAQLRAEMDGLAIRLGREYGRASQVTVRAEEIAHSVQRLEWALERQGDFTHR